MQKTVNNSYSACYIRQYGNGYMQPVDMPAVSSTVTLDSWVNQTNTRQYFGHSYATGEDIESYTIRVNSQSLNTAQSTQSRGLIGSEDNRTIAHGYENTGIVSVAGGTGFIVGNHHIATAAHCVYKNGDFLSSISIETYDRSGEPTGDKLDAVEVRIPTAYPGSGYLDATYDYALITVVQDLTEYDPTTEEGYVHFNIGNCYNMTNSQAGTIPLHVTGVPGLIGDDLSSSNTSNALYTHYGSVYGNSNTSVLCYAIDASHGQSGSPVYTITRETYNDEFTYTYTALAIHAYNDGTVTNGISANCNYNYGTLMAKHHLLFYNANPHASYN